MSDKDDGGPAFPETRWDDKARQEVQWCGMTLRDYFAAKALYAYMRLTYSSGSGYMQYATHAQEAAKCAYQLADAMLAERAK